MRGIRSAAMPLVSVKLSLVENEIAWHNGELDRVAIVLSRAPIGSTLQTLSLSKDKRTTTYPTNTNIKYYRYQFVQYSGTVTPISRTVM